LACAVSGVRRIYLFEATERDTSTLRYFRCEPELVPLFPIYSRAYRAIDPICAAYAAAPLNSDVAVQRIRPADIGVADFRRRFFDEPGIVERVSVVQRGPGGWHGMNVARHRSDGAFADGEIDALVGLAWLALPMLAVNRARTPPSVAEFERRFGCRAPDLTTRERQVCARAAIGMSIEATAIDLQVARTTVLTYRQRAYRRLGVTSPYELASLVSN
jgi:DNA-binding CsgD family transcriptional regulator